MYSGYILPNSILSLFINKNKFFWGKKKMCSKYRGRKKRKEAGKVRGSKERKMKEADKEGKKKSRKGKKRERRREGNVTILILV